MNNCFVEEDKQIDSVFDNIKELVIHSRNKVYSTVNTEMLHLYWNIGKIKKNGRGKKSFTNFGRVRLF